MDWINRHKVKILKIKEGNKVNLGDEVTDFGSRMLHGLQTLGGSYIGDFIQGINPKAADIVNKYTAGMVAPTPKKFLESNRRSWGNKVNNTANTASIILAGEVSGPLIGAGVKKVSPVIKKAAPLVEKIIPKRSWDIDNALKNPEFRKWLKSNGVSDLETLDQESIRGLIADFNPTHNNIISRFPTRFNTIDEFEDWWTKYGHNISMETKREITTKALGKNYEKRLKNAADSKILEAYNRFYNTVRNRVHNFTGWRPIQTQTFTPSSREVINISDFSKTELISNSKDPLLKKKLSEMPDNEFVRTVVKPTGEVIPYGKVKELKDKIPLNEEEYIEEFNRNIHILNDIIGKNNKSGVSYEAVKLYPNGAIKFNSSTGPSFFETKINPGKWRGTVEDIPNTHYFREQIPGLEMTNTSFGVFGDRVARRGTKTYESLNEYLKLMDLGRVKPGFNSQTELSNKAWTDFIDKGKAVGFLGNKKTVYGVMKALPPIGLGLSQVENKSR